MKRLTLEIIDCVNGYIVLEGNSLECGTPYVAFRKKWVAHTPRELADLVERLAEGDKTKKDAE